MFNDITKRKFLKNSVKSIAGAGALSVFSPSVSLHGIEAVIANATDLMNEDSPKSLGFQMPEESAPHERTFMQWPVNRTVHSEADFLFDVQQTIAVIANAIADFEPVIMLADKSHHTYARKMLSDNVELWDIATDDLWCRDSGPLFLKNKKNQLSATHFNFNGWGNKQVHENDGAIAQKVAKKLGVHLFDNGLVGESGGFDYDGAGTLIAHESSWVNKNRNILSRQEIEQRLMEAVGARKVIWAPGVAGKDITDFHIDSLARFVEPGVVYIQVPDQMDQYDPWSRAAFETFEILKDTADADSTILDVIDVPEPVAIRSKQDDFIAAYPNYYVCNGAVICAEYGDKETDTIASDTLKELYPDREIVQLNVDALGEVGGGIHCATQQQPKSSGVWNT